jgi:hypothetical protein
LKHVEAKEHATAADQANKRASDHQAAAQAARRHAQTMEAKAASEHRRATLAEARTHKLAIEVANHANYLIAGLRHETVPPLRFDGCVAAATNGVEIRIDMTWLLTGIVDPAKEKGAIFGRIVGVVAHEWFHFLDTARGERPSHQEELLADAFAGKQLAKLGVPPNHFADLLRVFPQSSTHPDGPLRANKLLEAWTSETQEKSNEAAPQQMRFDGCVTAETNGVEIRIDRAWLLSGIVDPVKEERAIFGRIVGAVAHEWFHFLDSPRGERPSHQGELLADAFAGKQLAKLGVPPNHFADLLRVFPQSPTHPDGPLRADKVLEAWTSETQERASGARKHINTIAAQPVEAAVPVEKMYVAQAPRRRTRSGPAKKSPAKKSPAKKSPAKKSPAKKSPAKKSPAKKSRP